MGISGLSQVYPNRVPALLASAGTALDIFFRLIELGLTWQIARV